MKAIRLLMPLFLYATTEPKGGSGKVEETPSVVIEPITVAKAPVIEGELDFEMTGRPSSKARDIARVTVPLAEPTPVTWENITQKVVKTAKGDKATQAVTNHPGIAVALNVTVREVISDDPKNYGGTVKMSVVEVVGKKQALSEGKGLVTDSGEPVWASHGETIPIMTFGTSMRGRYGQRSVDKKVILFAGWCVPKVIGQSAEEGGLRPDGSIVDTSRSQKRNAVNRELAGAMMQTAENAAQTVCQLSREGHPALTSVNEALAKEGLAPFHELFPACAMAPSDTTSVVESARDKIEKIEGKEISLEDDPLATPETQEV